jgi:TonB-dependent starch-binding outer membrane protein SusC
MIKSRLIYYLLGALLTIPWNGFSQGGGSVTGVVKDAQNAAIPGVSVIVKGTTKGSATDADGKFSIQLNDGEETLVFSFVGFQTQEVNVKNQTNVTVSLVEDVSTLQEIVVVGYGEVKKSDLTGAVAQLKVSDLSPSISGSMDNLLKGRASGVQVISSSGQPGASTTIRIRGANSFVNSDASNPLLVVDGIPIGDAGNLKQINPLDIERIDILKDASASAIYGARASNGVIQVTTKKGKENQSVFEANYQLGIATLQKPFDIISDPFLYAQLQNETAVNVNTPGNEPRYVGAVNPNNGIYYPSLAEIQNGTWGKKTNWPDQVFQNGVTQNVGLAARGGNQNTKYALSFGYFNQEGMVISNTYKKYTTNLNIEQRLRKNIKAGATVNFAVVKEANGQIAGSMAGGLGRNPVFPIYNDDGTYLKFAPNEFGNPIAIRKEFTDNARTLDLFASAFIDWEIVKGLSVRSNLRTKYGQSISDYYEPRTFGNAGFTNKGEGRINNYLDTKYVFDNYATYNTTFSDVHNVTAMVGTSYEDFYSRKSDITGRGYVNDFLRNENMSTALNRIVVNDYRPLKLFGMFGRLMYNYSDRYLITATLRRDGSSRFGSNNKYGNFPSAAVAWNIHKESFFSESKTLSTLKLRVGYGVTGNTNALEPFRTKDQFGNALYWMDNGSGSGSFNVGYGPGFLVRTDAQGRKYHEGMKNNDLKWETTRMYNLGIDAGLFGGRAQVSVEVYDKYTDGLLRQKLLAPSTGFYQQWQNNGAVSNKGIELAIDGDIISSGNLTWNAGFNISHNKSEVKKVDEEELTYLGESYTVPATFAGNEIEFFRAYPNYLSVGNPMLAFYGYKSDGIIQESDLTSEPGQPNYGKMKGLTADQKKAGEFKYVDLNGDSTIDMYDRTIIGNPNPKFFFGFNTSVQYKNLRLAVFLTGSYGNDVINQQRSTQASSQYQRWTVDNPTNEYPRLNDRRLNNLSTFYIEDGSFMKIQNISLSYNFKLANKYLKSLTLNANCENVWTFTSFSGYDPEVGFSNPTGGSGTSNQNLGVYNGPGYARPRLFSFGVNFTF